MKKIEVYQIESGIPMPEEDRYDGTPLSQMEVGESMLVPLERRAYIQSSASKHKKSRGMEFIVRKVDDEHIRVWRKA